jgi:hypothetical protein
MPKKTRIRTELVTNDHAYTSVDVPWEIDTESGSRLFRYLRSGGVRAFGSSSQEAARQRRQNRFFAVFGVLAVVWFLLWLF